jgi:glycosyltransferase involved in cell wall biosynthesis
MKLAICQCILTSYRLPVFRRLSQQPDLDVCIFFGNTKNPKFRKYQSIEIDAEDRLVAVKLSTISLFLNFKDRLFPVFFWPTFFLHLIRFRPDVILTEGESNLLNNLIVFLYCKVFQKKYVWWGLGRVRVHKESVFRRFFRPLIALLLRNAGAIAAYSSFGRDYYISQGGQSDRVFVAHNSLDTDQVANDIQKSGHLVEQYRKELEIEGKTVLIFVGALEKTKNIENLIHVFLQLESQFENLSLIIVGDGEYRDYLEVLCKKKNTKDVIFVGKRTKDVSVFFLLSDIFVLPGLGGLSINHAMAHGLPVVACPADGTEQDLIENGNTGYIVPVDDLDQMEHCIRTLIEDPRLRCKMGDAGRKKIDCEINIYSMVEELLKAIRIST